MRVRQACATAAGSTRLAAFTLALCALLAGCGGGGDEPVAASPGLTVPKARCGPNDRVEAGLQGQVPMAERAAGFQGYNCNLALASQVRSDRGANTWEQFVSLRDRQGRLCGYAGSAPPGLGGLNTIVVDLTDPDRAVQTAVLTTPAMAGPGEGLRAHQGRGLLIAARYNTGPSASAEAHGFDVYDVGTDCRHPQLLASTTALAFDTAGLPAFPLAGAWPQRDNAYGHEGAISPDGLTYYISDFPHGVYHAVDITDPTRPLLIGTFQPPGAVWKGPFNFEAGVHGLSLSNDGTRGYFTTGAFNVLADAMVPQTGSWRNGFLVVDTSEIQARLPNARMRVVSEVNYRDGAAEQMTIPFQVRGRPYLLSTGEAGTGQLGPNGRKQACAAGMTPFGIARIYDIGNEEEPQLVRKLVLEVNDPKNCATIEAEMAIRTPNYDSHLCSVDNRDEATTLVCSHFHAGIRVFDIRDPANPREIAYYNPPSAVAPGKPLPWCGANSTLDASTGRLYTACGGHGVLSLRFTHGAWPIGDATTPADKQL